MALPFLQSYNDPKLQKAYERYMAGDSQRKILSKVKIPARTLARYCKNDGWESERKARATVGDSPNVAAVAAEVAAPAAKPETSEPRGVRMERMLEEQQYLAGILKSALRKDIETTLSAAEATGKPLTRSQIAQLTNLTGNILTLERKAWCVPDKIETKDTTPTPADRVRNMKDDELERELADAERTAAAAASRETPAASVN